MKRVLPVVLVLAHGCAIDANPPPAPTAEEAVRGYLAKALGPGAIELASLGDRQVDNPSNPLNLQFTTYPFGGATLARVRGEGPKPFDHMFVVRDGVVTTVTGDARTTAKGPQADTLVPLADAVLLRRCDGTSALLQILRGTSLGVLDDGATSCAPPTQYGPSAVPERFVTLRYPLATSAELQLQRIEGAQVIAAGAPTSFTLAEDFAGPDWFGEVQEGVLGTAWLRGASWRYERTDGVTHTIAAPTTARPLVRKNASTLELLVYDTPSDSQKLLAWNVDGDGALREVGAIPADELRAGKVRGGFGEAVFQTVETDPRDPAVTFPASTSVRVLGPAGFETVPVPSTPCTSRDTCRPYGESELLGVVGPREARLAFYYFWSWRGPAFLYAAPVAGRTLP